MASLDKAIAELSAKFGSHPGGGDSMELPHIGGPTTAGMGMPAGTIGTNSLTAGQPTDPVKHGTPKSAMAAGTVGTQKSAEVHHNPMHKAAGTHGHNPLHHAAGTHGENPLHRHHLAPKPQPPVAEPTGPRLFAQGASPGATVGTKGPAAQSALSAAVAAPAPAGGNGLGDLGLLTGGGPGGAQPVLNSGNLLSSKGGGGAPGGIIGTRGSGG